MIDCIPASIRESCAGVSVRTGDATQLDYPSGCFDYVLCMRFFNIVPDVVRRAALKEFARVASIGVIMQVRFCGWAGPFISGSHAVCDVVNRGRRILSPRGESQDTRARLMRPKMDEFHRMVSECGLRVMQVHRVRWGLTLSPMTVCVLQHERKDPEETHA